MRPAPALAEAVAVDGHRVDPGFPGAVGAEVGARDVARVDLRVDRAQQDERGVALVGGEQFRICESDERRLAIFFIPRDAAERGVDGVAGAVLGIVRARLLAQLVRHLMRE